MSSKYFFSGILSLALILGFHLERADFANAFTSSEGGFSIAMPGEPRLEQVNHKSCAGNVKEYSYTFENQTEKYSSSYTQLPNVAFDFLTNDALLNKVRKGFLK